MENFAYRNAACNPAGPDRGWRTAANTLVKQSIRRFERVRCGVKNLATAQYSYGSRSTVVFDHLPATNVMAAAWKA